MRSPPGLGSFSPEPGFDPLPVLPPRQLPEYSQRSVAATAGIVTDPGFATTPHPGSATHSRVYVPLGRPLCENDPPSVLPQNSRGPWTQILATSALAETKISFVPGFVGGLSVTGLVGVTTLPPPLSLYQHFRTSRTFAVSVPESVESAVLSVNPGILFGQVRLTFPVFTPVKV